MLKQNFYAEFKGSQTNYGDLVKIVKERWIADGNKLKDLVKLDIYFKPEESACYYVANETHKGSFEV